MENELAVAVPSFHAVALNATDMIAARSKIRVWLADKLCSIEDEQAEVQASLDSAKKHKWKTSSFENMLSRIGRKHLYYTKLLAAVDAGFTIVPNMDVDVFAIRVDRDRPKFCERGESDRGFNYASPHIPPVEENRLPEGEGHYESPEMKVTTTERKDKNAEGKEIFHVTHDAIGYEELEFPLAVANPLVMDAVSEAMKLKIFDRIGIVPRRGRALRGDPIVLGQITTKQGYTTKTASFLIAWYLDVRTL